MTSSEKEEIMTGKEFNDAVEEMIQRVKGIEKVKEVSVDNAALHRWEKKARELTTYNRRLRLERNYEE